MIPFAIIKRLIKMKRMQGNGSRDLLGSLMNVRDIPKDDSIPDDLLTGEPVAHAPYGEINGKQKYNALKRRYEKLERMMTSNIDSNARTESMDLAIQKMHDERMEIRSKMNWLEETGQDK